MMISDSERREVARKLRKCTPPTSYSQAQGGGWAHLCDMALVVGFKREDNPTAWEFAQRLADLIEPTCDRDALLALADGLEKDADNIISAARNSKFTGSGPRMEEAKHDAYYWRQIAARIREALGVSDA